MRSFGQFCREETGSCTIEFVLWIPVFMALAALVIDATTLYITQSEIWNVARDTARQMTSGMLNCESEAEQHVIDSIRLREAPYNVSLAYDDQHQAQVVVWVNVSDASILGTWSLLFRPLTLNGGKIFARVVMRRDPRLPFDCGGGGGGGGGGGQPAA